MVGNLMTLAKYEPGYEAFELWKRQYGPMYTIWLGSKPMVILTTYELMKNTYIKDGDAYIGKLHIKEGTMAFRDGDYGIVDTVGDQWREHRRFALQTFRDLGLGNNILQERKTIDEFRSLKKMLNQAMKEFQHPLMLFSLMYPWTRHVSLGPLGKSKWDLLTQYKLKFFAFFEKQIQAHNVNFDEDSESRDYVEAYLKEKKKREDAGDYKSYWQFENVCWLVVYILNHLHVQAKMQEEMDRVIGSKRQITMSDKNALPYVNAVINETQRLANLLPMNLMHETVRDVEINGYKLEKGTTVVAQISTVMYDEETFPDAYSFKPERFIDENGHLKKVCKF
ncbi:hypothetical protein WR25_18536 [Diploscapter pachys]|uniref:Cytochrome P450 n=1 Tax=Diploscapter pachys TaxID=2018661 RepID=A0A2A2LGI8_9BILA|nr:hypothetical protein WR25_18536 [Diploscapter pachys]